MSVRRLERSVPLYVCSRGFYIAAIPVATVSSAPTASTCLVLVPDATGVTPHAIPQSVSGLKTSVLKTVPSIHAPWRTTGKTTSPGPSGSKTTPLVPLESGPVTKGGPSAMTAAIHQIRGRLEMSTGLLARGLLW
jgi:hypothetical protein